MTMMSQLALLEHPATPELLTEQWLSSIWRLWVAKVLAAHGAVQLTRDDEGISRILQRLVTKADKSFDIHWPGHQRPGIS